MLLELWKQWHTAVSASHGRGVNVPSQGPPPNSCAGKEPPLCSLLSSVWEGAGGFARKQSDTENGQQKLTWHQVTQRVLICVFLERSREATGVVGAETSGRGSPEHCGSPWPGCTCSQAWSSVLETLIQCLSFKPDISQRHKNRLKLMGYSKLASSFGTPCTGTFIVRGLIMPYFVAGNTLLRLQIKDNSVTFCMWLGGRFLNKN